MTVSSTASMNRIGYIREQAHTFQSDELTAHVKTFFDDHKPVGAVVITEDAKPVGLVMKIHMNLRLSQRYGFSLFCNKPISSLMDRSPMMVNHDKTIEEVAEKAMKRDSDRLYDHIIILKKKRLWGIVPVRTILNQLVESQRQRSDILERYAGLLEQEDLDKKQAISNLKESRRTLQQVIDAIPHAVFWKNQDRVYLGCNKKFAMDAGLSDPGEIKGLVDEDLPWPPRELELFREQDLQVMSDDAPRLNMIRTQTTAEGERRFINKNKIPLRDATNKVVGILCFYQDITRQVRVDDAGTLPQDRTARARETSAAGCFATDGFMNLKTILK